MTLETGQFNQCYARHAGHLIYVGQDMEGYWYMRIDDGPEVRLEVEGRNLDRAKDEAHLHVHQGMPCFGQIDWLFIDGTEQEIS